MQEQLLLGDAMSPAVQTKPCSKKLAKGCGKASCPERGKPSLQPALPLAMLTLSKRCRILREGRRTGAARSRQKCWTTSRPRQLPSLCDRSRRRCEAPSEGRRLACQGLQLTITNCSLTTPQPSNSRRLLPIVLHGLTCRSASSTPCPCRG